MASTFTFGKAALLYIQPLAFVGIRMVIAGFLLLGYQYIFNRSQWRFEWKDTAKFAAVSFFLMFFSFAAEFWGMQYVSAAKACLIYNSSPFITALLAYWLLNERITGKQWAGLIVGFLGFIPILINQMPTEAATDHFLFISLPEFMVFLAAGAACYGWITTKQLVVGRAYSTVMVNGVSMLFGGMISLFVAWLMEPFPWIQATGESSWGLSSLAYARWAVVGYTVFLILVANVICFNLYSWLLHRYTATFISFVGFTTPLFAAFFDLLYFGQFVSASFFLTVGIVGIGIYLFYQDELTKKS